MCVWCFILCRHQHSRQMFYSIPFSNEYIKRYNVETNFIQTLKMSHVCLQTLHAFVNRFRFVNKLLNQVLQRADAPVYIESKMFGKHCQCNICVAHVFQYFKVDFLNYLELLREIFTYFHLNGTTNVQAIAIAQSQMFNNAKKKWEFHYAFFIFHFTVIKYFDKLNISLLILCVRRA